MIDCMTLEKFGSLYPKEHEAWLKNIDPTMRAWELAEAVHTTRAVKVNGMLFMVWDNGCFIESYKLVNGQWISQDVPGSRAYRNKFYKVAVDSMQ